LFGKGSKLLPGGRKEGDYAEAASPCSQDPGGENLADLAAVVAYPMRLQKKRTGTSFFVTKKEKASGEKLWVLPQCCAALYRQRSQRPCKGAARREKNGGVLYEEGKVALHPWGRSGEKDLRAPRIDPRNDRERRAHLLLVPAAEKGEGSRT